MTTWTNEYKRGYSAGYMRASRHSWPEHLPPLPPDLNVAALMEALLKLRDEADEMCATLDAEDEFVKRLSPRIDEADQAMSRVTEWLQGAAVTAESPRIL